MHHLSHTADAFLGSRRSRQEFAFANQLLARTTKGIASYIEIQECVNTHHFRMSVCVCLCGDMTWVFGLITHIMLGRARRSPHACASVVCVCVWGCWCLAVLQRTYKRAITSWPCHSASLQTTGLCPRTHAKLYKSIVMALPPMNHFLHVRF